ncbi:MAG: iron-containing alcohol dehydrogenase [Kiritimatiellae bacterium]|nr:iron-containing alcohol dehydrogenase [Kiritimatiellia bacterium]
MEGFPDTKSIDAAAGAAERMPGVFRALFPGARPLLVADPATWRAAGERLEAAFRAAGAAPCPPFVFAAAPSERSRFVEETRLALEAAGAGAVAVAVGSGTINDLCKRASFELGRPYACFATAASVDGFASFGAPITDEAGFKITRECPAPRAVSAEPEILAAAPAFLASSGYGDLLGKVAAGADWLVAELVTGRDPVDRRAWELVQGPLERWVAAPEKIAAGDPAAVAALFEGLVASGLAMQVARSSRPASGTEHHFSHTWEMSGLRLADGSEPTHGHKVALGTVCSAALTRALFARDFGPADVPAALAAYPSWAEREARVRAEAPDSPRMQEAMLAECRAKHLGGDALRARLEFLAAHWGELRERALSQLERVPDPAARLAAAGCPARPADLATTGAAIRRLLPRVQMIRRRYTALDVAFETGRLGEIAAAIPE